MKVLLTGFDGEDNSSRVLVKKIGNGDKLYLENSFDGSVKQFKESLNKRYDLAICFGQAALNSNNLKIETIGRKGGIFYKTKQDYETLADRLKENYEVTISNDAGDYLCNNLYFYGLKYIEENSLGTKMIFVHLPMLGQIEDIDKMAEMFTEILRSYQDGRSFTQKN